MESPTQHVPKVLIVDDETDLCSVLADLLTALPAETFQAKDGIAAMDRLKALAIDVVICDWNMPKFSGADFLRMARLYGYTGPIIMISGYIDQDDAVAATRLGANGFISKPFSFEQISTTVRLAICDTTRREPTSNAPAVAAELATLPNEVRTSLVKQLLPLVRQRIG